MIVEYVKQLAPGVRFIVKGVCKMTYTTLKDFELFKRECNKWIYRLGLHDWEITFFHEPLDGYDAEITSYLKAKEAVIRFSKTINIQTATRNMQIKRDAQHEIFHLLLENLYHYARDRYFLEDVYRIEEHIIIHRLQKAFDK